MKRTIEWMGKDLVIHIYNENGHIGSVVTGEPYIKENETHVTFNTWNQLGHKDDIVATMESITIGDNKHSVVSCICGIHLDHITPLEMQAIFNWVKEDIKTL